MSGPPPFVPDQNVGVGVIAAYVPDLMDRSKLAAAAEVAFAATPADLAAMDAEVYVVDLSRPGVLDVLPALRGKRVIGFGSHVATEVLEAARQAGVDEVLPRSRFFSRLKDLF